MDMLNSILQHLSIFFGDFEQKRKEVVIGIADIQCMPTEKSVKFRHYFQFRLALPGLTT
jgi:hypothetical protein